MACGLSAKGLDKLSYECNSEKSETVVKMTPIDEEETRWKFEISLNGGGGYVFELKASPSTFQSLKDGEHIVLYGLGTDIEKALIVKEGSYFSIVSKAVHKEEFKKIKGE